MVLADLAEFTHFVTRVKIVPAVADDISLSEAERTRGRAFAAALSMRVLSRTWQMLLKGIAEVKEAGRPIAAAEMVLVRIAYAADLPTPDEVIRALGESGGAAQRAGNGGGGARRSAVRRRRHAAPRPRRAQRSTRRAARRAAALAPPCSTAAQPRRRCAPAAARADSAPALRDRHASRISWRSPPRSATSR